MLAEDELSKDLLKKTNYSKNKTIESEAEMSTSSDEFGFGGKKMLAVETRTQTDFLLGCFFFFFLQKQRIKNTPNTYLQ